jgi:hypothetical protein
MFASTTSREREQLHAILTRVLDDIRGPDEQSVRD